MSRKILVITPMNEEMAFFAKGCDEEGLRAKKAIAGRLPVQVYPDSNLVLASGGTGKAQFAVQTQHLLDTNIQPDLVVCAGAAGALVDHLIIGDIVIGTVTVEHDIREGFVDSLLPTFEANPDIIGSLSQVSKEDLPFSVHMGAIASGDEDIVSDERRRALHSTTGAIAAGWEGAGGARACRFSGVDYVEIRGITDGADASAAQDFERNLELAMGNLARFLVSWISLQPQ
jgi:adenosylhomocysteine nucleosidase